MKVLTKEEVQGYTKKLYRFLREGHTIRFQKLPSEYMGIIHWYEDNSAPVHIEVDYRNQMFGTLLHEFLHYIHPTWKETQVLEMEERLVNALSRTQVKNILKRLGEAL